MPVVVDTTVLVYAVGGDHAAKKPCRWLIEAVGSGQLEATTTVEVIQEFAHVRERRMGRADAVRTARSFADLLAPLIYPSSANLLAGLELFESTDALGAFDAVLAAAALELDYAVVSVDSDFATVTGLKHLNPLAPDFKEMVDVASRR